MTVSTSSLSSWWLMNIHKIKQQFDSVGKHVTCDKLSVSGKVDRSCDLLPATCCWNEQLVAAGLLLAISCSFQWQAACNKLPLWQCYFSCGFSVTVSVTVILFQFQFQFQLFFQLILQLFDISVTVTVILNINKLDTKHAKYCIQLKSCHMKPASITRGL